MLEDPKEVGEGFQLNIKWPSSKLFPDVFLFEILTLLLILDHSFQTGSPCITQHSIMKFLPSTSLLALCLSSLGANAITVTLSKPDGGTSLGFAVNADGSCCKLLFFFEGHRKKHMTDQHS